MKLEFDLPDTMITGAVELALRQSFDPGYHSREGLRVVAAVVAELVAGDAVRVAILATAERLLPSVISDAVGDAIKREVKRRVEALRKNGELLPGVEP